MTRSSGPPPLPELPDDERMRRGGALIGNMILFFAVLGFFMICCMWLFSDISGEYFMQGRNSSVRLSIIRQPTNLWGELAIGNGAVLELITTDPPENEIVNFVFETPKKWQKPGQQPRQVAFTGTLKDGVMVGEFQEGKRKMKAKLERSGINSVYRQIEAHLPWQLYKKIFDQE